MAAIPDTTWAVRLHADDEVRVETLPVRAPGPGEVLVRMHRAPINPADLNVIAGTYGRQPPRPAILGNEGAGAVVAVGAGVVDLVPGDAVRPADLAGTWCGWTTLPATRVMPLPHGLDWPLAAQAAINPATAWAVLDEFAPPPGAALALNAPRSGVGRSLLALANARGWRVAALVRRAEDADAVRALGAAAVAVADRDAHRALRAQLGDVPVALALNQVGGDSATALAKLLTPRGWLVTVGALARAPLTLPNGPVIFNELRCAGFWVSRWYERAPAATLARMRAEVGDLLRRGALALPVAATYALTDADAALAHARRQEGRVLFACDT
jgi:NADPH:quinone reductase-like Zn-dependent oxidoreductase